MASFLSHSCVIPNLSAALFRREALALTEGFSSRYSICSDWNLFIELSLNWDTFYILRPLNKFRQHKKNIRSSVKESALSSQIIKLLVETSSDDRFKFGVRRRFRKRSLVLFLIQSLKPDSEKYGLRNVVQPNNLGEFILVTFAGFTAAVESIGIVFSRVSQRARIKD